MNKEMEFLIYHILNEDIRVNAIIKDETIWLTQRSMGELFDVGIPAINKHLHNIYEDGELNKISTISKMEIVQKEGSREVKREQVFYNLDVIISVGYRVNSRRATHFRIWATDILKEYMTKGFAMDDKRLKQGESLFGKSYFKELLERVRSIRASERMIWEQITDIFAECSIDYDNKAEITKKFYASIQNKFHFAIIGKTGAEIRYSKADRHSDNMGLTTWKNAPEGRILKSDAMIAKNYLSEKEIKQLERTVSGYFDYIEDLVERENTFTMEDFSQSINEFLTFRRYDILQGAGRISKRQADEKVSKEYNEFNKTQKIESDFNKFSKKILEGKKK